MKTQELPAFWLHWTHLMAVVAEASRTLVPLESNSLYETIDGQRVEKEPMATYTIALVFELAARLREYVQPRGLGMVCTEMLYFFPTTGRDRRPDVSFVSREQIQQCPLDFAHAWHVIPDLCIEIVSPTNSADDVENKVIEFLDAGVRQVWVLYPESRRMYVHRSRRDVIVAEADSPIEAEDLFPGLTLRLTEVFAAIDALMA